MDMIYHVIPGDSVAGEFKKTGIDGEVIVCRECLIVGDVDADTLFEFWEQRARFILAEYGEDEVEYHEKVADELARLLDLTDDDKVNLWFEYELFCSANLWFCLWLLAETGATVYRVEPVVRRGENIWKGFGMLDTDELKECFAARILLTVDDVKLGADLWNAYRKGNHMRLRELASSSPAAFPYLKEVVEAEIVKGVMPKLILREVEDAGFTEFTDIFDEFTNRAGVYGFGDIQIKKLLSD